MLYAEDFDGGQARDWLLDPGWEVVADDGGRALSGQGHAWARLDAAPWSQDHLRWEDYVVRFRLKVGEGALRAGVRVYGESRYFVALEGDRLTLFKQTGPEAISEPLAEAAGLGADWHQIDLAAHGATIDVFVDDAPRISYTDPDPILRGGVAFESVGELPVLVDDVEVRRLAPGAGPVASASAWASWTAGNTIAALAISGNSVYAGGEGGVSVWNRADGSLIERYTTQNGLPDPSVRAVLRDDEADALWVGTNGGAAIFNGERFLAPLAMQGSAVYGIVHDFRAQFWFAGAGGLWRFDPATEKWKQFSQPTGDLPAHTLTAAARDPDGVLYFGSEGGGLVVYDGDGFGLWSLPDTPTFAAFGRILAAPDGSLLFVQEYDAGMDAFDPGEQRWMPPPEMPCPCYPLAFDPHGNLWAGEWNAGFWIIGPEGETHISERDGLPADFQVTAVAVLPEGGAWIGTDHGLLRYDGRGIAEHFTVENAGFESDNIRALHLAGEGSLWVAYDGGVSRLLPDGEWEDFTAGRPFDYPAPVMDIAEDHQGAIWLATRELGVYRFFQDEWEQFVPGDPGVRLPSPYVNGVTVAPDGAAWFATDDGAARFDGQTWTAYPAGPEGLIHPRVNDIFVAEDGAAWFATGGGVSRLGP